MYMTNWHPSYTSYVWDTSSFLCWELSKPRMETTKLIHDPESLLPRPKRDDVTLFGCMGLYGLLVGSFIFGSWIAVNFDVSFLSQP